MVPPVASQLWPEMLPHHGIALIAGLRPDGREALHVVYSTDTPPWVLIGMLSSVQADITAAWQDGLYHSNEPETAGEDEQEG